MTSYSMLVVDKYVIILAVIFFTMMIVMELLIESIFTNNVYIKQNPDVSVALSSGITLFQFAGCALVPLISVLFQNCNKIKSPFSYDNHNKLYSLPTSSLSPSTSSPSILGFKPPVSFYQLVSYTGLSVLVFCATGLATLSVTMVSYPTKIVFKSAKLVPTMIMSSIMHGKTYATKDYAAALMLCLGAICFTYSPAAVNSNTSKGESESKEWLGILLLTASVVCDAIVPNWQQSLMSSADVSAEDVLVNTNVIGFLVLLAFMIYSGYFTTLVSVISFDDLSSSTNGENVNFQSNSYHIPLYLRMAGVGVSLGFAVNSYTYLIKQSGSVVAVSVATLRKIVTILLSYLVFPKAVTSAHLLGLVAVTLGILIESIKTKK